MGIISNIKNNALILLLMFFILTSGSVTAQINKLNSLIKDTTDYNFNKPAIFRTGIHFPMGLQPFVSGEVKLLKRLTLNMQLGASLDNSRAEWVVTDPVELADSDKISVSGFISPELRYYFLPLGRIKKTNRPLFGFSGAYLALKYFASTPSTKRNSAATYSFENVSAWQLNIGNQIQFKPHFFLGTFAGFVFSKNPINDNHPNVIPLLQFGFTVGYVF
ncbi:MAG: hypothetical protein CUR34_10260 [Sediminibacterium sp.]|nr:MAG: hypothetical protein CUR34_10260 [Sediminibacterium sp.] [Sediminibacterium sp. FEMGT703S]